jgi:hypothetical protein
VPYHFVGIVLVWLVPDIDAPPLKVDFVDVLAPLPVTVARVSDSAVKNADACCPSSKSASKPEPEPSTVLILVST